MEQCAEFEIILTNVSSKKSTSWTPATGKRDYQAMLRFTLPGDKLRQKPLQSNIRIDYDALASAIDAEEYGKTLTGCLMAPQSELRALVEAKLAQLDALVAKAAAPIRLRIILSIAEEAPELHNLHWEKLWDFRTNTFLLTRTQVWFSRFLRTGSEEQPGLRPESDLSALVFIASPIDLDSGNYSSGPPANEVLHPVEIPTELSRAALALDPFIPQERRKVVARQAGQPGFASLAALSKALEEGPDLLYLACHGGMTDQGPLLLLENEADGSTEEVEAAKVIDGLISLPPDRRPRLVFLSSCESGGTGNTTSDYSGTLRSLGAQLAGLGIPAVIAMQGKIPMQAARTLMVEFFTRLKAHRGQVDAALAEARLALRQGGCPEWWMPVLYLGLQEGSLWNPYILGEDDNDSIEPLWNTLKINYDDRKLVPILGPGLSERFLGSHAQINKNLADEFGFPLDEYDSHQRAEVTLFYLTVVNKDIAYNNYRLELKKILLQRFKSKLQLQKEDEKLSLKNLLFRVAQQVWQTDQHEAYYALAGMDFPVYFCASPEPLMAEALRKQNPPKEPVEIICQWRHDQPWLDENLLETAPTPQKPWVIYLFGEINNDASLAITPDDFFEFLIYIHEKRIPDDIWRFLTQNYLLFLGFDLRDWSFRVLFRSVLAFEGSASQLSDRTHIAAQLDPHGERIRNPREARKFLKLYLTKGCDSIKVLWMDVEDFVKLLAARMKDEGD